MRLRRSSSGSHARRGIVSVFPTVTPDCSVSSHRHVGPFRFFPRSRPTAPFPPIVTPDRAVFSHGHARLFRFFPRSRQTVPVLPRVPENHSNISDIRKRSVPFSPILASDRSSSSPGRSQPGRSFLQSTAVGRSKSSTGSQRRMPNRIASVLGKRHQNLIRTASEQHQKQHRNDREWRENGGGQQENVRRTAVEQQENVTRTGGSGIEGPL